MSNKRHVTFLGGDAHLHEKHIDIRCDIVRHAVMPRLQCVSLMQMEEMRHIGYGRDEVCEIQNYRYIAVYEEDL
jgi:hypothetical protein